MKLFDVRILKVGEIFRDDVMSTGMYLSLPDTKPELQVTPHHVKTADQVPGFSDFQPDPEWVEMWNKSMEWVGFEPSMDRIHALMNTDEWRKNEAPSVNFQGCARGMARMAAILSSKGTDPVSGKIIISKDTWEKMHAEPEPLLDAFMGGRTCFTQGGVNLFRKYPEPNTPTEAGDADLREGWVGWYGHGGSVLQWHPDQDVGFAYAPTHCRWFDDKWRNGGQLQKKIMECLKEC